MSDRRYSIIVDNFNRCFLCGSTANIHKHEVFFGTANRTLSIKYGLVIPLCVNCHITGKYAVHNCKETDIKLKIIAQRRFMEEYPHQDFVKVFGKNFI